MSSAFSPAVGAPATGTSGSSNTRSRKMSSAEAPTAFPFPSNPWLKPERERLNHRQAARRPMSFGEYDMVFMKSLALIPGHNWSSIDVRRNGGAELQKIFGNFWSSSPGSPGGIFQLAMNLKVERRLGA